MHAPSARLLCAAAALLATGFVVPTAQAQGFLSSQGQVLAATGEQVPGLPPGVVFGGSSTFDSAVIDESGRAFFRARFVGGTVMSTDERAFFYGKSAADLGLVIRGGDPAPGLPVGVTLNTATASGIGGSPRLSANSLVFFSSAFSGAGVTTADDSGIFGGPLSTLGLMVREGDQVPGALPGTLFSSSFSGLSQQPTGINNGFRILFRSSTIGGDTNGTINNDGWFTGIGGAGEQVIRKGDTVFGGAVIGALGFVSQMNSLGQILHDETLSTTLGTTPATTADDKVLYIWTPGIGNIPVVREGDPVPFLAATFNIASNSWNINTGSHTFNNNGICLIVADMLGAAVTTGLDDRAVFMGGIGGLGMVVRRGDAAPGTDANFDQFNNSSLGLNNSNQVCFQSSLIGGTSTSTDDSGIWTGTAGALTLVAREGAPTPGIAGGVFGGFTGLPILFNDRGQILFNASAITGAGNVTALYCYDPIVGVRLVTAGGDPIEVAPGVIKNVGSFGGIQFNNGNGGPLSFNANGDFALRVTMSDGTAAIMLAHCGSFNGAPKCISAATGGAHDLFLDGGTAQAGNTYLVVGSVTGTTPGFNVGPIHVPLNNDPYFSITVQFANTPAYMNTFGTLDAEGQGTATINIPAGIPSLAGLTLNHAFLGFSPLGALKFASEAASLTFIP